MEILNSRDVKHLKKLIKEQWDAEFEGEFSFLQKENDIFIISKDFSKINYDELRLNSGGLYIGELYDGAFRLSIEGSQIVGPSATKNVLEISEKEMQEWLRGLELHNKEGRGFVIITHKDYFLGCGKEKNGRILNYVSKARRIQAVLER